MAAEHSRKWRQNNPESYKEGMKKQWQIIKLRMQTDPEFAEKRKRQRADSQRRRIEKIKADPVQREIFLAKQREQNNKLKNLNPEKIRINEIRRQHRKKAKLTLRQIEATNAIRMKRFKNSFLTPEQKKEEHKQLSKQWKANKNAEFLDKYGFTYYAYCNVKERLGFDSIEEVIDYRIEKKLSVKPELIQSRIAEKFKPVFKKIVPVQVADEPKPTNKPMKIKQTKEQAFRNIQLRIIDLERVLSSQPQELKIRVDYLRNQFVSQYGAMPI